MARTSRLNCLKNCCHSHQISSPFSLQFLAALAFNSLTPPLSFDSPSNIKISLSVNFLLHHFPHFSFVTFSMSFSFTHTVTEPFFISLTFSLQYPSSFLLFKHPFWDRKRSKSLNQLSYTFFKPFFLLSLRFANEEFVFSGCNSSYTSLCHYRWCTKVFWC